MIHEISIKDLGVIQSATLPLTPGFTAVTGETGAGKTMVVTALGLLLGDRADSGVVRHAAERAQVSGRWVVSDPVVTARVDELGGVLDDGELVVTRSVSSEGRSKVVVGGAPAPVGALGDIGGHLVAGLLAPFPPVRAAVRGLGGLELKPLMAQALHMGDEVHNRNAAATGNSNMGGMHRTARMQSRMMRHRMMHHRRHHMMRRHMR